MKKTPIIIDCDPGHDDAIALVLAYASSKLDVLGVTTTAGNQTLAKTTNNALRILSLLGKETPLAKGVEKPMARELEVAPSVHGDSGLDGPVIPDATLEPVQESALDLTRRLLLESDEKVTVVATGPLTNVGLLLTCYPELKEKIEKICLMGGGIELGNWTSAAEFNILVDPEAANIVFESGLPIVMCGLDVTEKALILQDDVEKIRNLGGTVPVFVAELVDFFYKFHLEMGFKGAPLHDPCTIAYLIDPDIFVTEDLLVHVETQGKLTTGMTFADRRINPHKDAPNAKVCMNLDRERFIDLLYRACESYNKGEQI